MKRAVLRWHGGKLKLSAWIIAHFPAHRIYVETHGGGGSVLHSKPRVYSEVYNDIDGDVVNLFRVLRDPCHAQELAGMLRLTPYAREEFVAAYEPSGDPVESARRLIVRSLMGFGSASANREYVTGFRSNANRSGTTPAHDWMSYPDALEAFTARLQGVVIENRDAVQVIETFDRPDALFYVDPPYVSATRSSPRGAKGQGCYKHEMTDDDHRRLADALRNAEGAVVLSGYQSELYDEMYAGWKTSSKTSYGSGNAGACKRIETLWLNERAANGIQHVMELDNRANLD